MRRKPENVWRWGGNDVCVLSASAQVVGNKEAAVGPVSGPTGMRVGVYIITNA